MKQKIQIFLSLLLIISPLYIKADTPNVSVEESVSENKETSIAEEKDFFQEEAIKEENHQQDDKEEIAEDNDTEEKERRFFRESRG